MVEPSPTDPRGDPRRERDVRPVVAVPPRGLSGWVLALGAVLAGLLLFGVLNARRRDASVPAVVAATSDTAFREPPPLVLPEPPDDYSPVPVEAVAPPPNAAYPPAPSFRPQSTYGPPPQTYVPQQPYVPPESYQPPQPRWADQDPAYREALERAGGGSATNAAQPAATGPAADRTNAGVLINRATTVIQGTLIPAVLETALDSTRNGFARALVQRDIRGFDGSRILIPRGSRLIGDYSGQTSAGQKRAMVTWVRLIRPDGVTIAIGSPATDPVGRGGIKAKVDSHFLERFAGAILQSSLDIGVNLAARASDSPVIVALPGSLQGVNGSISRPANIPPTLSVEPGTSISVFVARDLDFTSVETGQ